MTEAEKTHEQELPDKYMIEEKKDPEQELTDKYVRVYMELANLSMQFEAVREKMIAEYLGKECTVEMLMQISNVELNIAAVNAALAVLKK